MGKFVDFTREDFLFFDLEIRAMGYKPIPIKWKFGEQGYYYVGKDERISFVWTSYVPFLKKFRDVSKDAGRAGIKKNEVIMYMSKDFLRTSNFLLRLLVYAEANKYRVDHPVVCPHCGRFLAIVREWETKDGKPTRRYYQVCKNRREHPNRNVYIAKWDEGMRPDLAKYLAIRRDNFKRYKERLRREEKQKN